MASLSLSWVFQIMPLHGFDRGPTSNGDIDACWRYDAESDTIPLFILSAQLPLTVGDLSHHDCSINGHSLISQRRQPPICLPYYATITTASITYTISTSLKDQIREGSLSSSRLTPMQVPVTFLTSLKASPSFDQATRKPYLFGPFIGGRIISNRCGYCTSYV